MNGTITSEIVVSYPQCPRKAYLQLCTNEQGTVHEYVRILQEQKGANQKAYIQNLKQRESDVQPYNVESLSNKHAFLVDATLKADSLEAECGVLTRVKGSSALGRYSYEPTTFAGTHRISKEQKLELFHVAHVLGQVQAKHPLTGRVIGVDGKPHRVKLEDSDKTLMPLLEPLQEWATDSSAEPAPLILNKHCNACRFQAICREQAEQEDNLSLLGAISTRKAIQKYERKGIFTVKQLSYTFRPRKRKKRAKNPPPVIHKPELQALAIREGKIYLQELPELSRQTVKLFIDIEGIPDQGLHYLIGVLVCDGDTHIYHPFWADTPEDEAEVWQQFLAKANEYPEAPIYHYGSYEPRAVAQLAGRYQTDAEQFKNRLVNVKSTRRTRRCQEATWCTNRSQGTLESNT